MTFLPKFSRVLSLLLFRHCLLYFSRLPFNIIGTLHLLLRPVKTSTSSKLYSDCFSFLSFARSFGFCVAAIVPQMIWIWKNVFYPKVFPTLHSFPLVHVPPQLAFIKVSLGASRSSLRVAAPPTVFKTQTWTICLFESHSVLQAYSQSRTLFQLEKT